MKRIVIVVLAGLALVALSNWLMPTGGDPLAQAQQAYQQGDYTSAVQSYQQAAPQCADLAALAANQAAALYRLQRFDLADQRYELAETHGDALRSAQAAYDRGNCALHEACRNGGTPDFAALDRAAEQYRDCLRHESDVPGAEALFADARHNLELTKLLRNPASPEEKTHEPSPLDKSHDEAQATAANQSPPDSNSSDVKNEQSAEASEENASPQTLASLLAQKDDEENLCPD